MAKQPCGHNENILCDCAAQEYELLKGLLEERHRERIRQKNQEIEFNNLKIRVWNNSGFFGRLWLMMNGQAPK